MKSTKLTNSMYLGAALVPLVMAFAALHSPTRTTVYEFLQPEYRTLLSTAFGNVLGDGTPIRVMKVQTREGLSIEIYKASNYELVDTINLDQKRDGFFTFHGEAANLVLADVDGDQVPEILAPGYDQNLSAQLNVYRYDRDAQQFHRMTDPLEIKVLSDL